MILFALSVLAATAMVLCFAAAALGLAAWAWAHSLVHKVRRHPWVLKLKPSKHKSR